MAVFHVNQVKGTEFPAGRLTKVIAGPGAPAEPDHFVMGQVTIYPGGEIPAHHHEQEEIYYIAKGEGICELDQEQYPIVHGSYIHIPSQSQHYLKNTGKEDMIMLFCYAPKGIVEHWQQELQPVEGDK